MKKWVWIMLSISLPILAGILLSLYRREIPVEELRLTYADEASRFLSVDGMEVHYKDEGEGPALVLLHGFASSLHTWDGWVGELAPSLRLVRLDLPGHGLTGPNADNDYRPLAYAAFLDRFLDRLGLSTFFLAGNSMGGEIAWLYGARHPDRASKLVLLDAAGAPREGGGRRERGGGSVMSLIRLPVVDRLVTRFTPRLLFRKALFEVYSDDSKISEKLIERHYRLTLREGNRQALAALLSRGGEDHSSLIPTLAQPTLILWGRDDAWIPVSDASRFHAALPRSELIIYDGVGHLPMEEHPAGSAADARAFLLEEFRR